jgi:hypothetical protein
MEVARAATATTRPRRCLPLPPSLRSQDFLSQLQNSLMLRSSAWRP